MTILRPQWEVTEQGGGGEGGFNLRHQVERPTDGTERWRWGLGTGRVRDQSGAGGMPAIFPKFLPTVALSTPPLSLPSELAFSEDPALNWSKRSALHLAFPEATAQR